MLFKSKDKRRADHTCRLTFDVSISQKKNALKVVKGTEPLISGLLIRPCYCVLLSLRSRSVWEIDAIWKF
jgi:hypothetical protein